MTSEGKRPRRLLGEDWLDSLEESERARLESRFVSVLDGGRKLRAAAADEEPLFTPEIEPERE
jgi:hypothetical protein